MDLMDDEDLKKSVIDQMMGELDDVTSESLKKPKGVSGVAITICVSPKGEGEEDGEEKPEEVAEVPGDDEEEKDEPESSDYISQLLKKLG
jgi:hypothetical protein